LLVLAFGFAMPGSLPLPDSGNINQLSETSSAGSLAGSVAASDGPGAVVAKDKADNFPGARAILTASHPGTLVSMKSEKLSSTGPTKGSRVQISVVLLFLAIGTLFLGPWVALLHAVADTLGNFRWQALFFCSSLGVYMLWNGRRTWAAITFALVAIFAIPMAALYLPTSQPPPGKTRVRLLSFNLLMKNHDHEAVHKLIRQENADILCLIEVNARWEDELLDELNEYPYRIGPAMGNVICSKVPLKPFDFRHPFFGPIMNFTTAATCEVDGQPVLICCTHTSSPVTVERLQERDGQLRLLAQPLAKLPPFFHIVIAGDFNATTWCRSMREFRAATGLRDTRQGFGMQSSWPSWFWPLAICIDHAFVSEGIHVHNRRTGDDAGSDHLPVILDLSFGEHPRGKKPEKPAG
jgi:endonuclease/exonuclease/phosphatase (EEP) superfamily protein YafD